MYSILIPVVVTALVILVVSLAGLAAFAVAALVRAVRKRSITARSAHGTAEDTGRDRSRR